MATLPPVLGVGQFYGNTILYKGNEFTADLEVNSYSGIEIQFFSPTGEFVGYVGTNYDQSKLLEYSLKEKKIGGLSNFKFSITKDVNIPFYNLMLVKVNIDGVHWFTGELLFKPNQGQRSPVFKFEGKGFVRYLKEINVDLLYQNEDVNGIVKDLVENYLAPQTPILYNASNIVLPTINVVKLELKNKSIEKGIQEVLEIVNKEYRTTQYRYYIDKDLGFHFKAISNDVQTAFFEGFQFQDPTIKTNTDDIINLIDIYRSIEDSQNVQFVSRIEDTESQGLYGIQYHKIVISDFVDTTTAENIANAMLQYYKEPLIEAELSDLTIEENPYEVGFYNVVSKQDDYTIIVNEFEDLAEWDVTNITNTVVTEDATKVLTGKKSFKAITTTGSTTEYIEYELDETIYYPTEISFYLSQSVSGGFINIILFDEDGNDIALSSEDIIILNEEGDQLLNEEGGNILDEVNLPAIEINIVDDFQKQTFPLTLINNIKKVRILFVSDTPVTFYFDRLEVKINGYLHNKLVFDEIEYKLENNQVLANCKLGEKADSIVDKIKKLDKRQGNILDIFQKS